MRNLMVLTLFATLMFFGGPARAGDMLQVKGSDTLINLVQRLAEVYMERNPGSSIAVTGGGSGTGVAALLNKKCDIANSSREITADEMSTAHQNEVDVRRVVVAMDGLSVIVNKDNSLDKLTMEDIGRIFRGEVKNWSELGGDNLPITLYGRQSNSGTYLFFREFVLEGDYSQKMNHMNGNAQIIEAVVQDKSGIGYVGVGYLKEATGVNVVHVAAKKGGEYVDPQNEEAVLSGLYPIARPLNQYIDGLPSKKIKDFLAFEISSEGQKVVEEEGFFRIPTEYEEYNKMLGL